MRKPKIITKYTSDRERLIEYSFDLYDRGGFPLGGLIKFAVDINNKPHVVLYRHDKEIEIYVAKGE